MNQGIKLLDMQANFTEQDIIDMFPEFEKFAELIVKECCKDIEEDPFNAIAASV